MKHRPIANFQGRLALTALSLLALTGLAGHTASQAQDSNSPSAERTGITEIDRGDRGGTDTTSPSQSASGDQAETVMTPAPQSPESLPEPIAAQPGQRPAPSVPIDERGTSSAESVPPRPANGQHGLEDRASESGSSPRISPSNATLPAADESVQFAILPPMKVRARQISTRRQRAVLEVSTDADQPPMRVSLSSDEPAGRSFHLPDGRSMNIKLQSVLPDVVKLYVQIDRPQNGSAANARKYETATTVY